MDKKQEQMLINIKIPLFVQQCPSGATESNCALRTYIKQNRTYKLYTFRGSMDMYPDTHSWSLVCGTINKMYEICAKCRENNK